MKKIIFNIFKSIEDCKYVLVGHDKILSKNITFGFDLDFFCEKKDIFIKKISPLINFYIKKNYDIEIFEIEKHHTQIDLIYKKKLILKLDIYDSQYENNFFKKNFITKIIRFRKKRFLNLRKSSFIYIPCKKDEIFLRYTKYLESKGKKQKHLNYYLYFKSNKNLQLSFRKYIKSRQLGLKITFDIFKKYLNQLNYYRYKFKNNSINQLIKLILIKLFK